MTPYQTRLAFEGVSERTQDDFKKLRYGAWHTEMFHRSKRVPALAQVMGVKKSDGLDPRKIRGKFEAFMARQKNG